MRLTREVLLPVLIVAVAVALSAIPASAAVINNEATGAHCSSVTFVNHGSGTGGCIFSATNEGSIELGTPFGMIDCDTSLSGRIAEDETGFINAVNLFNCNPSTFDECKEAGVSDNWPIALNGSTGETHICIVASGFLTVNCHLTGLALNQSSHTNGEVSTTGHQSCEVGGNSIEGHWSFTMPGAGFEVVGG